MAPEFLGSCGLGRGLEYEIRSSLTLVKRKRNQIPEIKLEDGSWINDREDI